YVRNSLYIFNLTADEMVDLRQQGVPDAVIRTMLERDADLRNQAALARAQIQYEGGSAAAGQAVPIPTQAPPVYATYPEAPYDYPYDYDYYPYSYWPPVYVGFGGWGYYGGRYYGGHYYAGHHYGGQSGRPIGSAGHSGAVVGGHGGAFGGGSHGG